MGVLEFTPDVAARPPAAGVGPAWTPADVTASVMDLPARYLPERGGGVTRRYLLRIAGGPGFSILARPDRCLVGPAALAGGRLGRPGGPTVEVAVDAEAWLRLARGDWTAMDLFLAGRLRIRGDLNEALRLETLFAPPPGSPGALAFARITRYRLPEVEIETFEAGPLGGPVVLALHGLGASKVSMLPVIAGLASGGYRVIAMDLPGFGKSGVPRRGRYTPGWFAEHAHRVLDAAGAERAGVVGNSLGGRVAAELALRAPDRIAGAAMLCPAVAFDEYDVPLVRPFFRFARPDLVLGSMAWPLPARLVDVGMLRTLFADPGRVPHHNLVAARDDFLRSIRPRANRLAIMAVIRQLGLERTERFWERLEGLAVPSLWIFGDTDRLVRRSYAERVSRHAPGARVELWRSCGHVPQFELPHATTERLRGFFADVDDLAIGGRGRRRLRAVGRRRGAAG
jgi:pimeloyl-ACP methyl ester carboxylesterase